MREFFPGNNNNWEAFNDDDPIAADLSLMNAVFDGVKFGKLSQDYVFPNEFFSSNKTGYDTLKKSAYDHLVRNSTTHLKYSERQKHISHIGEFEVFHGSLRLADSIPDERASTTADVWLASDVFGNAILTFSEPTEEHVAHMLHSQG